MSKKPTTDEPQGTQFEHDIDLIALMRRGTLLDVIRGLHVYEIANDDPVIAELEETANGQDFGGFADLERNLVVISQTIHEQMREQQMPLSVLVGFMVKDALKIAKREKRVQ